MEATRYTYCDLSRSPTLTRCLQTKVSGRLRIVPRRTSLSGRSAGLVGDHEEWSWGLRSTLVGIQPRLVGFLKQLAYRAAANEIAACRCLDQSRRSTNCSQLGFAFGMANDSSDRCLSRAAPATRDGSAHERCGATVPPRQRGGHCLSPLLLVASIRILLWSRSSGAVRPMT
jgi:hypothetical protein